MPWTDSVFGGKAIEGTFGLDRFARSQGHLVSDKNETGVVICEDGSSVTLEGPFLLALGVSKATGCATHALVARDGLTRAHRFASDGHLAVGFHLNAMVAGRTSVLFGEKAGGTLCSTHVTTFNEVGFGREDRWRAFLAVIALLDMHEILDPVDPGISTAVVP